MFSGGDEIGKLGEQTFEEISNPILHAGYVGTCTLEYIEYLNNFFIVFLSSFARVL